MGQYDAKVEQTRLRRMVRRRGFELQASRSRTSTHPEFGRYRIVAPGEVSNRPFEMTGVEVEQWAVSPLEPSKMRHLGFLDGRGGNAQRKDRWLTPRWITDALGTFELDPCGAPGHDLAAQTYLLENGEDGLSLPWSGRVWLNPPYGRLTTTFLNKLVLHGTGTALTFARTETSWFQRWVWPHASAVLFIEGRVHFLYPDGQAAGISPAPSVLIAYGAEDARLLAASGIKGQYLPLR